jgi:hypothetical protein
MQPLVALQNARRAQALGMLVVAGACALSSLHAAVGALLGGALMALHLTLLHIIARFWLRRQPHELGRAALLLLSKFFIMAALTGAILLVLRPHAIGFLAGLGTFMVGIACAPLGHRAKGATPTAQAR